ncbi:X-linked retinitis pigmentosa GTPase regulator [Dirofilaria immitis]
MSLCGIAILRESSIDKSLLDLSANSATCHQKAVRTTIRSQLVKKIDRVRRSSNELICGTPLSRDQRKSSSYQYYQ